MNDSFPLSVVVAVTETTSLASHDSLPAWLAALFREAKAVGAELLLAGDLTGHGDWLVDVTRDLGVPVRILASGADALTPQLWGRGLLAARGDAVAFTINQCTVESGWAGALLAGLAHGDAGVGGRLTLAEDASLTASAIYFLRYSAFLGAVGAARRQVQDIAGDNAAYRRDVLMRYGPYGHGFWEIEAHHRLRADGGTLALVPGTDAAFGGSPPLWPFMRQRFAHGRHFGEWRVRVGGRARWQIALAAPLVPFVFLIRTARRVAGYPGSLGRLVACAGPFLALAAAWAAGEAAGAVVARRAETGA